MADFEARVVGFFTLASIFASDDLIFAASREDLRFELPRSQLEILLRFELFEYEAILRVDKWNA